MTEEAAHFSCTKLVVADLEKTCTFYKSVFGLTEHNRVSATIEGRPISEIMFHPTAPGGATFVLLTYPDTKVPALSEAITLFAVPDLAASLEKACAAGGRIVDEMRDMPEHGVKVAFVRDIEGHMIEVVELLETHWRYRLEARAVGPGGTRKFGDPSRDSPLARKIRPSS